MVRVSVAIIRDEQGRVLIARRKAGKQMAGCWEFPGGKIETGESPEESLIREMKEEMDVVVRVGEKIAEALYQYDFGTVCLKAFETHILSGSIRLLDHDAMAWASMDEMSRYGMTPADEPLIELLRKWMRN